MAGAASGKGTKKDGWRPSAIAADIATLGTGTLLAGVFNVALVFIVPKLVSVEDYGYWRLFGLYAGYVGFLHFGFADGALLRWAGRPMEQFHHELRPAVKYLFWQHAAVLLAASLPAMLLLRGPLRFVAIAVAIYAPLFNLVALLQFGLQGARDFRPVAASVVAAPALFCLMLLVWAGIWHSTFREVAVLFLAAWCVPLGFLLAWTKPWVGSQCGVSAKKLASHCVLSGWPIMMASTGVALIVTADRLAVSWAASIQDFAQYSLAASAMAVPITVIAACSKVFFPHLAGLDQEQRKRIYGISSWLFLMAWMILLSYYFALNIFVHHILPKYVPSLQYARILLLAVPFIAVIQILQMSYAYLNGVQKKFLVQTVAALAISVGLTSFAAFHAGSLSVIASTQVAVLGIWWFFNEWTLRGLTGREGKDWTRFAVVYVLAGASYWLASAPRISLILAIGLYYLAAAVIMGLGCREKLVLLFNVLKRSHDAAMES